MENVVRSERSRAAILQAALAVIARDGAHRLTLDAIAREAGISKGGVMHQFHTKEAVLKAMLEQQIAHFQAFTTDVLAGPAGTGPEPFLTAEIATIREAVATPQSAALAILGVLATDPGLLAVLHEIDVETLAKIRAEAVDPDAAVLRWLAARGLMFTAMFGLCPLSKTERDALFDRLMEPARPAQTTKSSKSASPRKKG